MHYWTEAIVRTFPKESFITWYTHDVVSKKGLLLRSYFAYKSSLSNSAATVTNHEPVESEIEPIVEPVVEPVLEPITFNYQEELKNILASSDKTFTYLRKNTQLDKHARTLIAKTIVTHLFSINEK